MNASITPEKNELRLNAFLRWSFYAFMFSLPYDVLSPGWLPIWLQGNLSITRISGLILTIAFLSGINIRQWTAPPVFISFGLYFILLTISMLRFGFDNWLIISQQFQLIILYFIIYNIFLSYEIIRGAMLSFASSCCLASILILSGIIVDTYQVDYLLHGRITGFGANPNEYSMILMVGSIVALGIGHFRKDILKNRYLPIIWGIIFANLFAIGLSGSRGSSLALILGFATFLLDKKAVESHIKKVIVFAVISFLLVFVFGNIPILKERWEAAIYDRYISGRYIITAEAIHMIQDKPFFGWGPEAKQVLAARLYLPYIAMRSTHNSILAMLTFNGIIGSLPFFYGLISVFIAAWRARHGMESYLPIATLVGVFIWDMSSGELPNKLHWTLFAYALASDKLHQTLISDIYSGQQGLTGLPRIGLKNTMNNTKLIKTSAGRMDGGIHER